MDTLIYYHGSDGHIKQLGDQELQHYKYIKKIGNRYFYTQEALRAYYNDQKKVATADYAKERAADKAGQMQREATIRKDYALGRDSKEQYERNKKINRAIYDVQGKYRSAKRTVKPVTNTAKRAVTPIKTPKERAMDFLNKNGANTASQLKKKKKKRMTSSEAAYAKYRRTHMSQKNMSGYQSKVRGA